MSTTEAKFEARFIREVEKLGCKTFKWTSPSNRYVPDRIVLLPGLTVYCELKGTNGTLSPGQRQMIQKLKSMQQIVYVLYPQDLPGFLEQMKALLDARGLPVPEPEQPSEAATLKLNWTK